MFAQTHQYHEERYTHDPLRTPAPGAGSAPPFNQGLPLGVLCAVPLPPLPLLGDAYGLYYNKKDFAAAGITAPPRTLSEFKADAVKLTKSSGGSYSRLGYMPDFHGYESTTTHLAAQWGVKYFDASGKSQVAKDPGFTAMFNWC